MAIIKMLNSKNKQTNYSMKKAVGYGLKMESINGLASGINCNFETAYEEFCLTKKVHHKENGRLYIHFEQSFPPDTEKSAEELHELGKRLIEECSVFDGYQVVIGTHTDKEHIHNHFVINSVNAETGMKWHVSTPEVLKIREKSLEICQEENIKIWWKDNSKAFDRDFLSTVNYGEHEKQKNGKSWKYDLFLTIRDCIKQSNSKESFIKAMRDQGYDVNWKETNKLITFITPTGMKCRNNKLYPVKNFTKENLLKEIENKSRSQDHESDYESDAKKQKGECFKAIMFCAKHSHSKEEFIKNMNSLGYGVQWDHHKHIVFSTPKGKKYREDKFYPSNRFSMEKLLIQFEKNAKRRSERTKLDHQREMNQMVLNVKNIISSVKHNANANDDYPITKLEKMKNLEGQALKEKAIEKANAGYNWENDYELE